MIESLTFPKNSLPEDFTAANVRSRFSEDEKIAFNLKKCAINAYFRKDVHLSIDQWRFDVMDCTEKVRVKLVSEFIKESFIAKLDDDNRILILSIPKEDDWDELDYQAVELRERIESVAMKRFKALCREIPEKINLNCNALIWHCTIYDTSEKIVDEIGKQILSEGRGFNVVVGEQALEAVSNGFYRTAQVLYISDPVNQRGQDWEHLKAVLEFNP